MSPKRLGIIAFVLVLAAVCVGFVLLRGPSSAPEAAQQASEAAQPASVLSEEMPDSAPNSSAEPASPAPSTIDPNRASSFILSDRSLVAGICTSTAEVRGEQGKALATWATAYPIEWKDAFVRTVLHIDATGALPDCYRSQSEFEELGEAAAGLAIGGDVFNNPGDALPRTYNGDYRVADLDYFGQRRSRNHLVFVPNRPGESLIWLSTDGLESFIRIELDAL